MTKHTDSSHSTDSGVSGKAQTGAREILDAEDLYAHNWRCPAGHGTGLTCTCKELKARLDARMIEINSAADGMALAKKFHEVYERLAPSFGYETRAESAKSWDEVPLRNKELMAATCTEILSECSRLASRVERLEADVTRWQLLAGKLDCKKCTPGLASRVEELEHEMKFAIADRDKYKAMIHNEYRASIGEVWHWQGDEYDNLESLTCPVLISANDLRRLAGAHAEEKE